VKEFASGAEVNQFIAGREDFADKVAGQALYQAQHVRCSRPYNCSFR
jgi:hypothetical protein